MVCFLSGLVDNQGRSSAQEVASTNPQRDVVSEYKHYAQYANGDQAKQSQVFHDVAFQG
jgi:hypothetical protein